MAPVIQSIQSGQSSTRVFGFPLEGFSLFQSLLLSLAAAFFTFFATTCISIFALLAWNLLGSHSVNFADSYRYVGFPAGVLVLVVALPYFLTLWVRAKIRQ
ncbi:MAG TPA: hypothetical protein V6C72_09895 [Chroococcales cyanobacterium]|nr:hypothetical protein [Terracidiphilus sp.]